MNTNTLAASAIAPTSYVDPIDLREVLELHYEGVLDKTPNELIAILHLPTDMWFENSLIGKLTSQDVKAALSQLTEEERTIIHYFLTDGDLEFPPELLHWYVPVAEKYPEPLDFLAAKFEESFDKLSAIIHKML